MSKNPKEYIYFRKVLPAEVKKELQGLNEFKISLKEVEPKHIELMKSYLHIATHNIISDISTFDRTSAINYIQISYHKALLALYKLPLPLKLASLTLKKQSEILTLEKAIQLFTQEKINDLQVESGTSDNYAIYSNRLYEYFNKNTDVSSITITEAKAYRDDLFKTRGVGTTNNILAFAKGLFSFLVENKHLDFDVFISVKNISSKRNTTEDKQAFDKNDINQLLNKCANKDMKLFMKIALYSGYRQVELYNLRVMDINLEEKYINCTLKDTISKKHTRTTPIHRDLVKDYNAPKNQDNFSKDLIS